VTSSRSLSARASTFGVDVGAIVDVGSFVDVAAHDHVYDHDHVHVHVHDHVYDGSTVGPRSRSVDDLRARTT
jgi:hypothetical protein